MEPIENAITSGGKLFGIVPKDKEREVLFVSAVIGIVLFVLYLRTKQSAGSGTSTDPLTNQTLANDYSQNGNGYATGTGTNNITGTTVGGGFLNPGGGNTGVLSGIQLLNGTQAVSAQNNSGVDLTLDLSTGYQNQYAYSNTQTKNSGSGGNAGLNVFGLFTVGGGGSTQSSETNTNTRQGATGAQQNIQAAGSNLNESEYNNLLSTLANVHRNDVIANQYQTTEVPK